MWSFAATPRVTNLALFTFDWLILFIYFLYHCQRFVIAPGTIPSFSRNWTSYHKVSYVMPFRLTDFDYDYSSRHRSFKASSSPLTNSQLVRSPTVCKLRQWARWTQFEPWNRKRELSVVLVYIFMHLQFIGIKLRLKSRKRISKSSVINSFERNKTMN